jgi:hypothetical protein
MWEKLQKFLDRAESRYSLWQAFKAASILGSGGALSGILSSTVAQISRYGWFGWWSAFLVGCVLTASAMALFATFKLRLAQAGIVNKWKDQVDSVNPLDSEFFKKRIKLLDLTHPLTRKITHKRFTDCQLVGPANLLIMSNNTLSHISFQNCDYIVTKRELFLYNAIGLDHVTVIGGEIIDATIFLHPDALGLMEQSGQKIYYPTLTGNAEIDSRLPPVAQP